MFKKDGMPFLNIALGLILFVVLFYVLYIGASLIIPFIIALLFSFAIIGLSNFYKSWKLPSVIAFLLSIATYSLIFWGIGEIINRNIDELIFLLPKYQEIVSSMTASGFEKLHITSVDVSEILSKIDIQNVFTSFVGKVTSIFSYAGIILFYVLFILLEYRYFSTKINLMITDTYKRHHVLDTIDKIKTDIKSYFVIKTVVSLMTSLGCFIIMTSFGLDFAIFWAFLIFLLNFIPSIGSIISSIFPIVFSLIQFEGSLYPFVIIASGVIGIQVFMGNIIEPRFVGNKLNLSPLVIILSLTFWGTLWGIVGMLLSVPIMVMINIILGKFPQTRSLAILLSEKGELQVASAEAKKERTRLFSKLKRHKK